ncbi:NUDIX domain-containing protein [uncultured Roseibium sp.]|uniref:NUDIX domain-containing protein n=1 Tax=uncultured Roseibium sp. TaxID=1936171 RepID=UPI00262DCFC2|nr:NUDIX domain-containing protein [uncultured Roseibium sp.]
MLKVLSYLPSGWTKRMIQALGLVRNPYTLGVRVLVLDAKERILLVRHSYLEGWYLPGGGVDRGETMVEAACREVLEEAGISTSGEPVLMNVYLNEEATGRDHVGLFLVSEWTEAENFLSPNAEIVEAAFFAPRNLPAGVTSATVRRIEEWLAGEGTAGSRW